MTKCLFRLAILAAALSAGAVPALAADVQAGQSLAFDRGKGNCLACHAMAGGDVPSSVGPELSRIKERFPERADLVAILTNEQTRNPQTAMPPFGANRILTPREIELVVDFLYSL